ncbi:tRNA-2-methylthio-N6-dimethylallyladenosine synthase [Verrucomicrobium sp. GAS474]|uniref:tRNA (N6-isopentenyl adenosine(37)-C2)-methylthiotransferase MiaB n=1 Tax=Verrucomicrobium sp. GAS474 TaxID=1882831 RepID=UPI000879293E|nr:tRNA (N6-isopentenyl adenosine(37)-C2)-methylthiotransferase MiaB [Verrucomicrobium sp. GAS474]SDU01238.1 tRNA-2-methylthio-N6-dimethylallyladenosine synthase [Verrucomicrobium sp. GAS474]
MPSVFVKTYGCQMNVRDSEQVVRDLATRGYSVAASEEEADVILLNTCSVRDMAEQKAIEKIGQFRHLKKKRPHLVLGLMGCMAQSRGASLFDGLPDLDLVVGTQKFHEVAAHVDRLRDGDPAARSPVVDTGAEAGSQNAIRDHVLEPGQRSAFVSIMQGCNMHCTFCIVPSTRGPERSRPIAEIVREVEGLVAGGVREVTLLGQIVNLYGRHEFEKKDGQSPFVQLLRAVAAVPGIDRVRFTSPHPVGFRDDLIEAIRDVPQICESVHMPLQSGSDAILKAMHRGYTAEKYLGLVAKLRAAIPDVSISTDIIVGFPGETEADFEATKAVALAAGFDAAYVFRYSPRTNTPAAALPDPVSEEVKAARNHDLLMAIDGPLKAKSRARIGTVVEILVEGESKTNPTRFQGRTRGNHLVIVERNERWRGQLLPVRIVETTGYTSYAEPALLESDTVSAQTVAFS